MVEEGERRSPFLRGGFSRFQFGIEALDVFEEVPDRGWEVEVLAQGVVPTLPDFQSRGLIAGWNWAEADGELLQAFDGAVGGLEQLGRERQWAPIVGARQQRITDRPRLVSLIEKVAEG